MANSKISALTSATTPLAGTETLPVIQSGATKQVSVANLTAGRTVGGGAYSIGSNQHLLYDVDASTIGIRIGAGGPFYNIRTTGSSNLQLNNASGGDLLLAIAGTTYLTVANTTGNVTFNTGNLIQGAAAKGVNFTANTPAAGMTSQLLNWYEEGTWTPNQGAGLTVVGAFSSSGTYTRIGRQVMVRGQVVGATSVAVNAAGVISSNLPFSAGVTHAGSMFNSAVNASGVIQITSASVVAATTIAATPNITFSATYTV
jgi:hypothetical protein